MTDAQKLAMLEDLAKKLVAGAYYVSHYGSGKSQVNLDSSGREAFMMLEVFVAVELAEDREQERPAPLCGVYRQSPAGRARPDVRWFPDEDRCGEPAVSSSGLCEVHEEAIELMPDEG